MKIGFIGAGNMGSALIKGILENKICGREDIFVFDKDPRKTQELDVNVVVDSKNVVACSDIVFLAVKPTDIKNVLVEIKDSIEDRIMVSIAAGIKISSIKDIIGGKKVARVMPNTPCLVGEMAAGFSVSKELSEKESETIRNILSSAGKAIRFEESMLDAVTGLSGSGPAFVAYLIESFKSAGEKMGLGEKSYDLALQTFIGTARLLQEKGISPQELIDMVSSPEGTTVAGREILERSDISKVIIKTIEKAAERSREMQGC